MRQSKALIVVWSLFELAIASVEARGLNAPDALKSDSQTVINEKFREEVEGLAKRRVIIRRGTVEWDEIGNANCYTSDIIITIRRGLDETIATAVEGHELGHAFLCAKGILPINADLTAPLGLWEKDQDDLKTVARAVATCMIEPTVNSEARKRGVDLTPQEAEKLRVQARQSAADLREGARLYGGMFDIQWAVAQFCLVREQPSLNTSKLAEIVSYDPLVSATYMSLEEKVKSVECNTVTSCFEIAKRVRAAAGLDGYFYLQNPTTISLE